MKRKFPMQAKYICYLVCVIFLIFDMYTKGFVNDILVLGAPEYFLPFWNWTLVYNYGAAFGFLSNQSGWQVIFLLIIASTISLFIIIWIWRINDFNILSIALTFVLGGALGNVIDRFIYGKVTDFISIHYQNMYFFPIFNIADIYITIGAGLLILEQFLNKENKNLKDKKQ